MNLWRNRRGRILLVRWERFRLQDAREDGAGSRVVRGDGVSMVVPHTVLGLSFVDGGAACTGVG